MSNVELVQLLRKLLEILQNWNTYGIKVREGTISGVLISLDTESTSSSSKEAKSS